MQRAYLLTLEKAPGNSFIWGRITCEGNLIVESARSLESLEKKIKKLLNDFHKIKGEITFEHAYDLTSLFEKYNYLNISAIAEKTGVNPSQMRQYASGSKTPSPETALKVERAIHTIAKELLEVRISTPSTRRTKGRMKKKQVA